MIDRPISPAVPADQKHSPAVPGGTKHQPPATPAIRARYRSRPTLSLLAYRPLRHNPRNTHEIGD